MKSHLFAAVVVVASTLALGARAGAAPGDLDPTFGSAGSVSLSPVGATPVTASSVTLQADGKIVITTNGVRDAFAVRRFLPGGSPDETFGVGGTATAPNAAGTMMSNWASATVSAAQPDGKIVVAGTAAIRYCSPYPYTTCSEPSGSFGAFALARFNTDGTLDAAFGSPNEGFSGFSTGTVRSTFHREGSVANAVVVQPDGKIVAAGSARLGQSDEIALARYNPDGSPDASFGGDGTVTTAVPPSAKASSVLLQPDGKIVVAGATNDPGVPTGAFALARYHADGSLDASFGAGGTVITAIGEAAGARAAVLRPDGGIVAAGFTRPAGNINSRFALVRYNPDGTTAAGFGKGGTVTTAHGTSSEAHALVLQPDGTMVAAGRTWKDGKPHWMGLVLYKGNGSLGTSFGDGGKATAKGTGAGDAAYGLALQPDGKLIAAGTTLKRLDGSQGRTPVHTKITVAAPEKVTYGQSIKYKIKVANTGNTDAHDMTLTFVVPPGVDTAKLGMTPAERCTFIRQDPQAMGMATVSCRLGTLVRKTSTTVTLTARPLYATSSPFKNTTFTTTSDQEMSPTSVTNAKTSVKVVCPKKGPCPGP